MNKLRGTGSTFSNSGKPWLPFRHNTKLAARNARLHRLKRKGFLPLGDKATQRALAAEAAATHTITRIPQGKRSA